MGNPATLKKIQKGQVLNPKGRPKGAKGRAPLIKWLFTLSPKQILPRKTYLSMKVLYPHLDQMTVEEFLHVTQMVKAIDTRDTFAYNSVMNGAHGMPRQEIENTVPDGSAMVVFTLPPKDQ